MSEHILILVWIGFVALLANQFNLRRTEMVCGESVERYMPWFAFLVFLPAIWMAGNRGWFADTPVYINNFRRMPSSISAIPAYIATVIDDQGFYGLSALIKVLIGNDYVIYFTIIAFVQGISIIAIFRRYSPSYILSIFFFIISADYVGWMYNGIRQFTAATVMFAATALMLKKKYIPLLLVILFASTLHRSALIMIPLVLIAQGEAWNRKTLIFIVLTLLIITFVGEFTNILSSTLEDTQYGDVFTDIAFTSDDGTNPLRVVLYSMPAILAFVGRKIIREENNKLINFCTNMSIISMGLYVVSMFTSGIFIGRLPIYASLYGYILLPWEIQKVFTSESKRVVYIGLIGCYCIYYYYQMHFIFELI